MTQIHITERLKETTSDVHGQSYIHTTQLPLYRYKYCKFHGLKNNRPTALQSFIIKRDKIIFTR